MSSKHNTQPKAIYQLEASDLEQLITNAVTAAMKRYTSITGIQAQAVNENDLMTVGEVCNLLHVTPATLNNWHKLKYLTKVKVGRRVLYHSCDVMELAAKTNKH